MNNKISNPLLKQLISEIASKANEGRINDLSWGSINEAKKKKSLKKEADEKKSNATKEVPSDEKEPTELPPLDATAEKDAEPKDKASDAAEPVKKDAAPEPTKDSGQEEADAAKEDAVKAKAELEKAKAEKAAAEKELEQHKYVKLSSASGTKFLLGKIVDHAFKAGEIDALAGEMVEKLKIKTTEDMDSFAEDVATYVSIPGMPELVSSMRAMATKTPEKSEEQPAE